MSAVVNSKRKQAENNRLYDTDKGYYIVALLSQARHAMFKIRQKELSRYNIRPRQASVLIATQAIGDKATPAQISRWLFLEPHSTSGLLIRMEKKGLVKKVKDLHRKNLVRVVLTKKGHEAYERATKRELVHWVLSALSEEEHQQLRTCLQKLRDKAFKELGIAYKPPFPPSQ